MDEAALNQRLSQINTRWTLLVQVHGGALDDQGAALARLVERYHPAVYRYLLGAVRDPDTADELFQEFALRFVRGDFRRADAGKGRFRDYVKTVLSNLVNAHRQKQARAMPLLGDTPAETVAAPEPAPEDEQQFLADWRKALLDRAWEGLAALHNPKGPPYHLVLRLRSEKPDLSSAQLAGLLTEQLRPADPFTDTGLRKILQRARDLLTDLLVEEVARSLRTTSLDEVEQELIDLGFLSYCRKALERRRGQADRGG
jgi:RNA polymerase sigma-70 factor (ECF subfamily)